MTSHGGNGASGAEVRAKLDHPVVDADGHMIECTFAVLDFVRQVGGMEIANRYEDQLKLDPTGSGRRAVWVGNSGPGSIDRATAMLPKLYRARLDEAGIDYGVVYGTLALSVLRVDDDELRPVVFRAMNMLYADMFKEVSDRLTPAALIPMSDPDEAVSELEFAVNELGLKAIVVNTMLQRPAPEVLAEAPHLAHLSLDLTSPGIDVGHVYDPVWAKCVELGVPVILTMGPLVGKWAHPEAVHNVAVDLPDLEIVCSHGVWPQVTELIALAYRHQNVYLEASIYEFLPGAEPIFEAANGILQDKIIYASGFPFRPLDDLHRFLEHPFDREVIQKLVYGNAARLLKLDT